jgi:tetratricopeptide (TPR) repeat protein
MTLNNLAGLLREAGRTAEAEPLYRRALALFEVALPPTHPNIATCLFNYAELLHDIGRHADARAFETRARRL